MEQYNEISTELKSLSSTVSAIEKKNPFTVPENYFEGLADKVLLLVKEKRSDTSLSSKDEIEALSPFLSSLKNKKTFSIPDGNYFDQVANNVHIQINKTEDISSVPPVIPISAGKKWMRYAAAAAVTGIIGISAIFFFNNSKSLPGDGNSVNVESVAKTQVNSPAENDFSDVPDDMLDSYLSSIPDKPLIESNNENSHFFDLAAAFDLDDSKLSTLLHEVSDEDLLSFTKEDDGKAVAL